ncbi:SHOCT domain-containing protein [Cryobacterium sp. PH31-L1]|uniref:SHOCT domain-containing protein n=1 Tax=Cryobacterium sp. PH31-L1 TaxID=3046199 RepID=UPI0024BBBE02|nr:SHOCT domain-containing protein [Cryobacterium sp. PH31-L1]MDJ0379122.1 SHOCT domain-containing protein [Cryobacterium sp. PH31-L1]
MMWGTGSMGWSWGFGLLAVAGIAILVYLVIRLSTKNGGSDPASSLTASPGPTSARKILDERFARGELTAEQYRDQIRVLGEDR